MEFHQDAIHHRLPRSLLLPVLAPFHVFRCPVRHVDLPVRIQLNGNQHPLRGIALLRLNEHRGLQHPHYFRVQRQEPSCCPRRIRRSTTRGTRATRSTRAVVTRVTGGTGGTGGVPPREDCDVEVNPRWVARSTSEEEEQDQPAARRQPAGHGAVGLSMGQPWAGVVGVVGIVGEPSPAHKPDLVTLANGPQICTLMHCGPSWGSYGRQNTFWGDSTPPK